MISETKMTRLLYLLMICLSSIGFTSAKCFIQSGDLNFIKDCSNCLHNVSGSYMMYELTRNFNNDIVFTLVETNKPTSSAKNCLHNGTKVVCYAPDDMGSRKVKLSAMKGNVVVNSSTFWTVNRLLEPCQCTWDQLQPEVQALKLLPNSNKRLQLAWSYLGDAKQTLRIESSVCIKTAGASKCNLTRCEYSYYDDPLLCEFHIDKLDYNTHYDICVRSKSNLCRNEHYDTCSYNYSLSPFYLKRFRLSNVSCIYDTSSKKVNLEWKVQGTFNTDTPKPTYSYSLYNERNDLLMENNRTTGNRFEKTLNSNAQILRVKLCLHDESCSAIENKDCVQRDGNFSDSKKNLLYLIPAFIGMSAVMVAVVVFLHLRHKKDDLDTRTTPVDGKDLEVKANLSDSTDVVTPNVLPKNVYEELPDDEVFDKLDLSHTA